MLKLEPAGVLRKFCVNSTASVAFDVDTPTPTPTTTASSPDHRDIEYYHRTMTSLLGRKEHAKATRVLLSIHEHDPVRLAAFPPFCARLSLFVDSNCDFHA